ncbi:MAG: FAD:protein FMN transferase [archaeon]
MTAYPMFGKEVTIVLDSMPDELAVDLCYRAYKVGLQLQKIFNYYDPKSELSKLNLHRRARVSSMLLKVLNFAIDISKQAEGFDVTLGKVTDARKKGKTAAINCSYKDIIIEGNLVQIDNPDVFIDLGGIAKGFIAEELVNYLKKDGAKSGLVDARGDLIVFGKTQKVMIQHPREKGFIGEIKIKNMAVATSGDYNQYRGSYENSHIIGKNDFISATVVHKSLMVADALATAVMTTESKDKIKKLLELHDAMALCIDKNMEKIYFNGFEKL